MKEPTSFEDPRLDELDSIVLEDLPPCRVLIDSHEEGQPSGAQISGDSTPQLDWKIDEQSGETRLILRTEGGSDSTGDIRIAAAKGKLRLKPPKDRDDAEGPAEPLEIVLASGGRTDLSIRLSLPPERPLLIQSRHGSVHAVTPMAPSRRPDHLRRQAPLERSRLEQKASKREGKAQAKRDKYLRKAAAKRSKAEAKALKARGEEPGSARRGKLEEASEAYRREAEAAEEAAQKVYEELMAEAARQKREAAQAAEDLLARADELERQASGEGG